MSSNGSPLRATEIGVKRSRKAAEPQHLSSFGLSSPEEVMNPAANQLSSDAQTVGDHTLNILNLAGAIAMNSLMAINQQGSTGGFPSAAQIAAQNPLLANAAKMMLSMNLMNAANAGERPSASNPNSELMSLVTSQSDATVLSVANLQQVMLLQQYAALARGQISVVNPQLAALHMSLKRSAENGSAQQSDRKRSFPSAEVPNQVDELRKRVFSDTSAMNIQRRCGPPAVPHIPVSKDDMERCLERILNEEIYNIFEDDLIPSQKEETAKSLDGSPGKARCSTSSGASSPIERNLSIDEILEIVANRALAKEESGIASVGSAFRKVSSRSNVADSCQLEAVADSPLAWATSLSPDGSSPRGSEPDVTPLTQELITRLHNLAISHREFDSENLDSALSSEDQLKVNFECFTWVT